MRNIVLMATGAAALIYGAQAMAQGGVGGALGAAAKPKAAAAAAAATVKPGEGGGAAASAAPQSLAEALAACDLNAVLAAGGTAKDAARVLKGRGQGSASMDPSTAVWVKNGPDADSFALAYQSMPSGGRGFFLAINFKDFVPPGGIASLPTADEAYGGPPPPPPGPTPAVVDLGKAVMAGLGAQEAATRYLAANPPTSDRMTDASQAAFARSVRDPGLVLLIPSFLLSGGIGEAHILLPGTADYPGLAAMRAENDSVGAPIRRSPPGYEEARAAPRPPPRDC